MSGWLPRLARTPAPDSRIGPGSAPQPAMPCLPRRFVPGRSVELACVHVVFPERAVAWRGPHLRHLPGRSGNHHGPVARPVTYGEHAAKTSDAHSYPVRGNYGVWARVRVDSGEIENAGVGRCFAAELDASLVDDGACGFSSTCNKSERLRAKNPYFLRVRWTKPTTMIGSCDQPRITYDDRFWYCCRGRVPPREQARQSRRCLW